MAEASVARDRASELVAQGEGTAKRAASGGPTLSSIVSRWQQSVGNRGVAQLSAMSSEPAESGGRPAEDASAPKDGGDVEHGEVKPGAQAGAKGANALLAAPDGAASSGAPSSSTAAAGDTAGAPATEGAAQSPSSANQTATTSAMDPASGVIEMDPMVITGHAPDKAVEHQAHKSAGGANSSGVIEMEPMVITGHAPDKAVEHQTHKGAAAAGGAAGAAVADTAGVIEMEPMVITGHAPDKAAEHRAHKGAAHAGGAAGAAVADTAGVIEMDPMVITGHAPSKSGEHAAHRSNDAMSHQQSSREATSQKAGESHQHGDELTKPGFTERNAALKGKEHAKAPKHPPKGAGAAHGAPGGHGGGHGGGGHSGHALAPKPGLGDPTLDKWKAAVGAGTSAVKPGDLGDAKNGAATVAQKGSDIDSGRKGVLVDPATDAKSRQPPLPKEQAKVERLNTAEADTAIAAVAQAGEKHLADQTLGPLGSPPEYTGATLAGADFVPKNLTSKAAELAAQLAALTDPSKRVELTKQLEALKKKIAGIEANAGKGTAPEPPKPLHDDGPAKLTPPDPAMGNVLGDAIARAMQSIQPKADQIVKSAVTAAHGDKVPKMLEMATAEHPKLELELREELTGIAAASGISKEQLDAKITEQKDVVAKQTEEAHKGVHDAATVAIENRHMQAKEEGDAVAGAKDATQQDIEDKKAAADGAPDTKAIEAKRDELLGRLESTGGAAYAGLRSSLTKRDADLDAASAEKKQMATEKANGQAAAIRRHWAADPDVNKGMVEARPTADWGVAEGGRADGELKRLKAAATAEHDGLALGITNQLQPGKDKIRDWAAHQQGRERSFWERLMDMFKDWGKQATANNQAWEKQRNAESREAMTQDLNVLAELKKAQLDKNQEAYSAALGKLSAEQRELAMKYLAGGVDSIGFVAESTMMRIAGRRKPELAKSFEERAIAEWDGESLGDLARATNPGFQPKVLANKVHGGVDGWGTNEAKVYEGLGGAKTPVERAALNKCYTEMFHSSMAEDVHDDMEGKEADRANALMSGDSAAADAATIAEAVDGLGTDEKAIKNALRGKTPEELEAIKAAYKAKYGVDLVADLRDDMSGAELENALALADGDPDKADAADLEDAMAGPGTDEDKMKEVYERIRDEEQKYAMAHGLTKAELDKRIKDRNARVSAKYGAMGYGDLTANAKEELSDGDPASLDNADNKLFTALQHGDESKIDAAKALVEKEGVYTSDDEMEKIVRNQRKKAEFSVNLDEAGEKARLLALAQSGDIPVDEYKAKMAALDPKDPANKEKKEAKIQALGKANVASLKSDYEGMANTDASIALHGKETFDGLIDDGTSGYSKDEIKALMESGGKLSDDQEIYYAIAGVGTDEDKIKETLKDKTPAEIQKMRLAYEKNHGEGSFDSDILGDLSGREDLDVGLTLKYGDPSTFAAQLDKADPKDRPALLAGFQAYLAKRRDFEKTGQIGAAMDMFGDGMNSSAQLEDAIDRANKYDKALTAAEAKPGYDPNKKDEDPNLASAKNKFDMNFQGAVAAQDEVREKIDAFTDVAAQVGGAVAGIAVTILTAGTAGPAVLALYAAAAAAATSIAMKLSLKGAAYGWEDLGIDLAVGVVDGAMSYATAGMGKAIMEGLERAVASQMVKMGIERGAESATAAAVKAFLKETIAEGIQNGMQAIPSAFVGGVLNGQNPVEAAKGAGMAGLQGAGVGMGIHTAKTAGGAVLGSIKGALKGEPNVESKGPGGAHTEEPHASSGSTPEPESRVSGEAPTSPPPEIDLPPAADPKAIVAAASEGKLPPEAHIDEGKLAKGNVLEPHEPAGPHGTPEEPHAAGARELDAKTGALEPVPEPESKAGPSHDDVGKTISNEDLAKRYGMPEENVDKIKAICAQEKVIVDVRPTTPYAEGMLREGEALPKPEKLKAKTINPHDVMLGMGSSENLGKVGFFPPEQVRFPENFEQLEPKLQEQLKERAMQRQAEWADHQGDMAKLQAEGKIRLEPDGTITNTGLLEGQKELPFTGDHDLFDIRHADGSALSPEEYKSIRDKLIAADAGIMHGAVTGWSTDSPSTFNTEAGQKSYGKMVGDHSVGGKEPLVRFGEGDPKGVWHEPALPKLGALPGAEVDAMLNGLETKLPGANPEGVTMFSGDAKGLKDASFEGGESKLAMQDVKTIETTTAGGGTTVADPVPPTLITDANEHLKPNVEDADFRPKRNEAGGLATNNVEVVVNGSSEKVRTPGEGTFGGDPVVGGVRGAELQDNGAWERGEPLHQPDPFTAPGKEGGFPQATSEEWLKYQGDPAKMTDAERYATWFYSDDASSALNAELRGTKSPNSLMSPELLGQVTSDIDKGMKPVPFDSMVHRGSSMSEFRELSVRSPEELAQAVGKSYTSAGYTSTSIEPTSFTEGKEVKVLIDVPKGTRGTFTAGEDAKAPRVDPLKPKVGGPIASMPGEMEFLLGRGTRFTITDVQIDPKTGKATVRVRIDGQTEVVPTL